MVLCCCWRGAANVCIHLLAYDASHATTRFHGIDMDSVMHPVAMHFMWRAALLFRLALASTVLL
jgi:hypothetical protein